MLDNNRGGAGYQDEEPTRDPGPPSQLSALAGSTLARCAGTQHAATGRFLARLLSRVPNTGCAWEGTSKWTFRRTTRISAGRGFRASPVISQRTPCAEPRPTKPAPGSLQPTVGQEEGTTPLHPP